MQTLHYLAYMHLACYVLVDISSSYVPSVQMDENLVQQLRLLNQTEVAALKSGATSGSSSQLPQRSMEGRYLVG